MKDSSLTRNYLYNEKEDIIYEITKIKSFGSYLSGDYLIADGSMYLVHKVNIIFLALPYLSKKRGKVDSESKGKMCEINEVFSLEECKTENERNGVSILRQSPKLRECLTQICDITEKTIDDNTFFMIRLNDEKLHSWLDQRLEKVKETVKNRISDRIDPNDENGLNLLAFEFFYEYMADLLLENYMLKYNLTVKTILQRKTEKRPHSEIGKTESSEKESAQKDGTTPTKPNPAKAKKVKTNDKVAKVEVTTTTRMSTRSLTAMLTKSSTK